MITEQLYNSRNTIKIGMVVGSTFRGTLFFDIKSFIENKISTETGSTAETPYSILNGNLTITSSTGKTYGNFHAFMLPLGSSADESVSWTKPSETYGITWDNGGSIEPLAADISANGTWSNTDLSFDITPFLNIWKSSNNPSFGVMLTSDETTNELWQFHSQQATSPLIGGSPQTNIVFLGKGDINTINTDGVLVKISPQAPYLSVEPTDSSEEASRRWGAFNASISVGNTFSMFLTDLNASASTYTLLDKRAGAMLISGSTAGLGTATHTTAEFSCTGTIPSGSGIVEFTSPSNSLIVDLATTKPNDPIIFGYSPTIAPNNATSFLVDFYSDEILKNNRVRLYMKQETASENRSGLPTEVKRTSVRPRLSLSLSL